MRMCMYRQLSLLFVLVASFNFTCFASSTPDSKAPAESSNVNGLSAISQQKQELAADERSLQSLGAFEISSTMLQLANANTKHKPVLNAGRGNPNWLNLQGRLAFNRMVEFGLQEARENIDNGSMAGSINFAGIGSRFAAAMDASNETDLFLLQAVEYGHDSLGLDRDALVGELAQAALGDHYPVPSRCLPNTEKILNAYLESVLYNNVSLKDETVLFPTEGGTAAICYIFNTLRHNDILKKGDKIAVCTPVFTPYLQIPRIRDYDLEEIKIETSSENGWNISPAGLAKLADPSIKACFLVNPANPSSHALSAASLQGIKAAAEKNPALILITDDVYGTFVDDFQSLYSAAPHNTILVYSFSKLYGVTGWRLGLVAMHKDNVVDELLRSLPQKQKESLNKEYSIVTLEPEKLPFIERMCADSRDIGLYHTSGLSTPQQAFMSLLALTHLVGEGDDAYIAAANALIDNRYKKINAALGLQADNEKNNAKYYMLLDTRKLAQNTYGAEFAEWFSKNYEEIDFLYKLAAEEGVVLMYGPGFDAPAGTLRVSLANLSEDDYTEIGKRILELMAAYHADFLSAGQKQGA